MSEPTDSKKVDLLFKEFTNTVNASESPFSVLLQNPYPFRNYVLNTEIFSNNIPDNLLDISFTDTFGITSYGLAALDASYGTSNKDISFAIPGTDLVYYNKFELEPALNILATKRTWYIDDGEGKKNSVLRDSIPYNYDASGYTYFSKLFANDGITEMDMYNSVSNSTGTGTYNIYWMFDYKSGFIQFLGPESDASGWYSDYGTPRLSFIKYAGPKGASGGGGGGDASYNALDVSNLKVVNLEVTQDTSINYFLYEGDYYFKRGGSAMIQEFAVGKVGKAGTTGGSRLSNTQPFILATCGRPYDASFNTDPSFNTNAVAEFQIISDQSGVYQTIDFRATYKNTGGISIDVMGNNWYGLDTDNRISIQELILWHEEDPLYYDKGSVLMATIGSARTPNLLDDYNIQIRMIKNNNKFGWDLALETDASGYILQGIQNSPIDSTWLLSYPLKVNLLNKTILWDSKEPTYDNYRSDMILTSTLYTDKLNSQKFVVTDISAINYDGSNINVEDLIVTNSAKLPENTLVNTLSIYKSSDVSGYPLTYNYFQGDLNNGYITGTSGEWFTIATMGTPGSKGNIAGDAVFEIVTNESGKRESLVLRASHKYGKAASINILSHPSYIFGTITALRMKYTDYGNGSFSGTRAYDGAYLQAKVGTLANPSTIEIRMQDNNGARGWDMSTNYTLVGGNKYITSNDDPKIFTDPSYIGLSYPSELLVDNLNWDPSTYNYNNNVIYTSPFRFDAPIQMNEVVDINNNVDISGNLGVSSNVDVSGDVNVIGDISGDNLTISTNGTIGRYLSIYGDSYIQRAYTGQPVPTTGIIHRPTFDQTGNNYIGLGWCNIVTDVSFPTRSSTSHVTFEITAHNSNAGTGAPQSLMNHTIVGEISLTQTYDGANVQTSEMINITHSSYNDILNTPPVPLIERVFLRKISSAASSQYELHVDVFNDNIDFLEVKFKNNNENIELSPSQERINFWSANTFFATTIGTIPTTQIVREIIIPKGDKSFVAFNADQIQLHNNVIIDGSLTAPFMNGNVTISGDTIIYGDLDVSNATITNLSTSNFSFTGNLEPIYETYTFDTSLVPITEWITLARVGDPADKNTMRADALFVIQDRLGSGHQTITFRAGLKFNNGVFIDVISNDWYNMLRFDKIRIVYGGSSQTYVGGYLQIRVARQSTSNVSFRVYENTNSGGWDCLNISGSPSPDNDPVAYITDISASLTPGISILSNGGRSRVVDLTYSPGGNKQNKVTNLDITNYENYFRCHTSNVVLTDTPFTMTDTGTGTSNVVLTDTPFTMSDTGSGSSNVVLTNTPFTMTGTGTFYVDNSGSTNPSDGVAIVAKDGIYLSAKNAGGSTLQLNSNSKTIEVNSNGLDVNGNNIWDVTTMDGNRVAGSTMTIRANNNGSTTGHGFIDITSPLRLPRNNSTDIYTAVNSGQYGTIGYSFTNNTFIVKPDLGSHPNVSTPLCLSYPTAIQLWDWPSDYNTGGAITSYDICGQFSPWTAAPSVAGGGSKNAPILFGSYSSPYNGFLTAVTIKFPFINSSGPAAIYTITRGSSDNGKLPSSKIIIYAKINNTTIYDIDTLLEGPTSFPGASFSNDTGSTLEFTFKINPMTNLIPYNSGDSIQIGFRFDQSPTTSDTINCNVGNLNAGATETYVGGIIYLNNYIEA